MIVRTDNFTRSPTEANIPSDHDYLINVVIDINSESTSWFYTVDIKKRERRDKIYDRNQRSKKLLTD